MTTCANDSLGTAISMNASPVHSPVRYPSIEACDRASIGVTMSRRGADNHSLSVPRSVDQPNSHSLGPVISRSDEIPHSPGTPRSVEPWDNHSMSFASSLVIPPWKLTGETISLVSIAAAAPVLNDATSVIQLGAPDQIGLTAAALPCTRYAKPPP